MRSKFTGFAMSEGRGATSDSSDDEEYVPPECEEEVSEESEEDVSDDEIQSAPIAKKESKEIEAKDREKIWDEFLKEVQPTKAKDEPNKNTSNQKSESTSAQSSTSKIIPTEPRKITNGLATGVKRPAPSSSNRATELLKRLKSSSILSGAPKMTTLEKSKLDWETFKQKEGIADDLKIHNKGKNGYVERKAFEARTQEREYQLLKEARLKNMRRQT